jgi:hypothetical protein
LDGADHITPTIMPVTLDEHIPGAVPDDQPLQAIDPITDAYKRNMGNNLERNKAEYAVLSAVEKARGMPDPSLPITTDIAQAAKLPSAIFPDKKPNIPGIHFPDLAKGDLITYVDTTGKAYDAIILKDSGFSVGEDGKEGVTTRWQPVQVNENKSDVEPHSHVIATYSVNGRINKDEFTRHIQNAVPGIDHLDPASSNYEKGLDRRKRLHAALEANVSRTLNALNQPNKENALEKHTDIVDPAKTQFSRDAHVRAEKDAGALVKALQPARHLNLER